MKFIYSLLENAIVVNLIAPVICSVMGTMIINYIEKKDRKSQMRIRNKIKNTTVRMIVVALLSFCAGWMVFAFLSSCVKPEEPVLVNYGIGSYVVPGGDDPVLVETELPQWTDDDGTKYTGNQKNGKIDGEGTAVYTSGEKYVGEFKDGLRDGEGVLYSDSEEIIYDGAWKDNVKEGSGTEYFPEVDGRYEGMFKAGKREGDGIYYWENGDRYEGKWENDVRNGIGVFIGADGTVRPEIWLNDELVGNLILNAETWLDTDGTVYTGKKENGSLEGYGRITYEGGNVYIGDVTSGLPDGQGIMYYADGNRYEGEWKNGIREGTGTYCDKDTESFYYGEWKNNIREGTGTYYNSNGLRYEGEWKENQYYGDGICWYSPKDELERWYFEGEWQGSSSMKGTMHYKDGTSKIGVFQGDELIEEIGEMKGIAAQSDVTTWTDESGNRYTGRQENGVLEGQGIRIKENNQTYIGEFAGGTPNGNGTEYYSNGDYYVGTFADGKRNGTGVYYYSDGGEAKSWYCGEWIDGKRNDANATVYLENSNYYEGGCADSKYSGMGSRHYTDGVYYGEWKDNARTGTGVFRGSDGSCYFGEYRDGWKFGYGVMYYIDGSHYEGEWENGKKNGVGTEYDAEGNKTYYGTWVDDVKEEETGTDN